MLEQQLIDLQHECAMIDEQRQLLLQELPKLPRLRYKWEDESVAEKIKQKEQILSQYRILTNEIVEKKQRAKQIQQELSEILHLELEQKFEAFDQRVFCAQELQLLQKIFGARDDSPEKQSQLFAAILRLKRQNPAWELVAAVQGIDECRCSFTYRSFGDDFSEQFHVCL